MLNFKMLNLSQPRQALGESHYWLSSVAEPILYILNSDPQVSKVAAGRSFVKCCLLLDAKDNSLYGLCGRVIYWDAMSSFGIWEKMDCLALLLSLFFCCLLSALLSIPPAVPSFPHPSVSLEVLPVYFPASPFAILIFPLCFKISLLSPVDDISFSESLSSL